jgi:uncharacterized membrane protein
MTKGRMEAFSDGVIAIIITIMVLELRPPKDADFAALYPLVPKLLCYVLSFRFVGIYWNNHHHLLQAVRQVSGAVLWSNLHLLFWLSLIPFTTSWLGESKFAAAPVAVYGIVLILAALAYRILTLVLVMQHGKDSTLGKAIGRDVKGKLSLALYAIALALSLIAPVASCALFALVAVIWLVPDRRIESVLAESSDDCQD